MDPLLAESTARFLSSYTMNVHPDPRDKKGRAAVDFEWKWGRKTNFGVSKYKQLGAFSPNTENSGNMRFFSRGIFL